jgi:isopentenyldiphosphate isomerase
MNKIPSELLGYVQKARSALKNNNEIKQQEIDAIYSKVRPYSGLFLHGEKNELLNWVNSAGLMTDVKGPRWLFHLLGLRHKTSHILLHFNSPALLKVLVLQVRSWSKFDEPGHLDVSVSGHVTEDFTAEESAYREMQEEIGLKKEDLRSALQWQFSYENFVSSPEINFYNLEWHEVYTAEINISTLARINFNDNEVVALYLHPFSQVKNLLTQKSIKLASGLKNTLPRFPA